MVSFKSAFPHLFHKSTPVSPSPSTSLGTWCRELPIEHTRLVQKVQVCTALCAGKDAWGSPIDPSHYHTLLKVHLVPTRTTPNPSNDVLFVERVLSTSGAHHSVTPISETFSQGGSLFHPDVHDRVCVTSDSSSSSPARHLNVERSLTLCDNSSVPRLNLAQFSQVIQFISRTTLLICAGGDCKFQSRSFAFTCMAALSPNIPPSAPERVTDREVSINAKDGEKWMSDSLFERSAERFLCEVPWLINPGDAASIGALRLMLELKAR